MQGEGGTDHLLHAQGHALPLVGRVYAVTSTLRHSAGTLQRIAPLHELLSILQRRLRKAVEGTETLAAVRGRLLDLNPRVIVDVRVWVVAVDEGGPPDVSGRRLFVRIGAAQLPTAVRVVVHHAAVVIVAPLASLGMVAKEGAVEQLTEADKAVDAFDRAALPARLHLAAQLLGLLSLPLLRQSVASIHRQRHTRHRHGNAQRHHSSHRCPRHHEAHCAVADWRDDGPGHLPAERQLVHT
mmetsp:Transcript_7418/g.31441  ORF Transcript_7418/g.31441 Transcript_7418/m.31441 type:complete len:240 (+) Transcript_7418:46-765(+)